ncbi:MAG: integrase domain-containing protein [Candidatus Thiodiazotropha lotti]|nr:integrase domain-containing protein [Candidatus Thiodiazotropha lotti]MCG8002758.1 integrase domain-containing protein [Candidatus Thiodiazotropha lotti]MCG8007103.1 integrase domain-containing protein [Candidatus Thiodiazotropha lotti]MCW4186378.1 integrase domain-containing protein [Candidatus Thiodiazotropha lotti]MCW4194684.1 integrase domain-containing protein [Candidatus Thiodiazotropha lotti]
MRGDRQLRVSPVELIGERHQVRDSTPAGWERNKVNAAVVALRERDQARVAAVAELTRDLGLRFREASLLDVRSALSQAQELGQVNITQGTKGGRGHEMDRWVPMSERVLRTLTSAAAVQAEDRNLVPSCMNFSQWKNHVYPIWSSVSERHGLRGFHDLRAAYACERYQQLTGTPAPAIGGQRGVDKPTDHAARQILSRELGHGRVDVVAAYVGSAR